MAKSAGFSNARKPPLSFLLRLRPCSIFLLNHSDTGILAYTLRPISSIASGDSIPRRKNTRSKTKPTETHPPNTIPINTIKIFFGLTGFVSATASSIILTFPIALDFEIFNSCCLFNNCIYIARPDSTSRLRRNTTC